MRKIVIFALALLTIGLIGTMITMPKSNTLAAIGLFQENKQTPAPKPEQDRPLDPEERLDQALQGLENSILDSTTGMVSGILDSTSDIVSDTMSDISGYLSNEDFGNFSVKKGNAETKEIDQISQLDAKGISNLNISAAIAKVEIKVTDSNQITAHLKGEVSSHLADRFTLKADPQGDTLNIKADMKKKSLTTAHNYINLTLTVQIPDQSWSLVSADVINGSIHAEQIAAKTIDIQATTGKIKLEQAQADKIKLSTMVGEIQGRSLSGELQIEATTGIIKIDQQDIDLAGSIQATSTTGSIDIALRPGQSVSLLYTSNLGNGTVNLEGMTLSESSKHKLVGTSGVGKYSIKAHTTTGSFKLHE
ncbi:DUF4097 family beta strand repeat-containing protein [Paenibacillus aceti]|uniref:DUF4097 domain-containing protein n=1 Tax=Paenibacillus aceti TaxID=1820010 RepID=A0ABQ1W647_9BACL|nr:DUF4097 family beta strand repeat-containing protein [Paenibacillus aceti]GGG14562.1 hypothetical protein GCM10010913_40480 [Paenibacillus aceti]